MLQLWSALAACPVIFAAAAIAAELDRDTCSPSLLQIGASVHEAAHTAAVDCGTSKASVPSHTPARSQLTLLQVSARTGEVSRFTEHSEDDLASHSADAKDAQHNAISSGRRHDIAKLLSQGVAPKQKPKGKQDDSANGKKSKDASNNDDNGSSNLENEANDNEGASNIDRTAQSVQSSSSSSSEERTETITQGARIAPFGKEDTGQELQNHAARTQNTLVDAIENAEVAEIKRSIFRSLTRLRAAEIKEFDTIARLETQAIDEYNDNHHYRAENPLDYIHNSEVNVTDDKYTSFHD
jgi:hypothetical protein